MWSFIEQHFDKKILTFGLIGVLLLIIFGIATCHNPAPVPDSKNTVIRTQSDSTKTIIDSLQTIIRQRDVKAVIPLPKGFIDSIKGEALASVQRGEKVRYIVKHDSTTDTVYVSNTLACPPFQVDNLIPRADGGTYHIKFLVDCNDKVLRGVSIEGGPIKWDTVIIDTSINHILRMVSNSHYITDTSTTITYTNHRPLMYWNVFGAYDPLITRKLSLGSAAGIQWRDIELFIQPQFDVDLLQQGIVSVAVFGGIKYYLYR